MAFAGTRLLAAQSSLWARAGRVLTKLSALILMLWSSFYGQILLEDSMLIFFAQSMPGRLSESLVQRMVFYSMSYSFLLDIRCIALPTRVFLGLFGYIHLYPWRVPCWIHWSWKPWLRSCWRSYICLYKPSLPRYSGYSEKRMDLEEMSEVYLPTKALICAFSIKCFRGRVKVWIVVARLCFMLHDTVLWRGSSCT